MLVQKYNVGLNKIFTYKPLKLLRSFSDSKGQESVKVSWAARTIVGNTGSNCQLLLLLVRTAQQTSLIVHCAACYTV
jgi:hypothetical protein